MPPSTWRTWPHHRVGGHVEGESKPDFGAYLIHVQPHPHRVRGLDTFHIHGNWGRASKAPYYSGSNRVPIDGELYYHNSNGCIILHRNDLLDLKAKWKKYVLHGAEHGPSSVGIPLKVEYFNKQVAP